MEDGLSYLRSSRNLYDCISIHPWLNLAQLRIVENNEMQEDLDPLKLVQLGAITITVVRGVKKLRPVPRAWSKDRKLNSVQQASDKMLKGKAIESSIRLHSIAQSDRK